MSDKNEYWKELFGDDFPENLADELGVPGDNSGAKGQDKSQDGSFNLDDDSQWFSLNQDLFKDDPSDNKDNAMSDTNVIPDGESISDLTRDSIPTEISGARPIYDDDIVPEDSDYITDDDIDDEERAVEFGGRRRSGYLGGLMYFAFVVGVSLILACVLWLAAGDVLSLNKEEIEADVTIGADDSISDIANTLKEAGFIEYPALFKIFAGLFNAEEKIDPGTYKLDTSYDYRALIRNMSAGSSTQVSVKVTIVEGKTLEDIFQLLEDNEICSYDDLMDAATNYDFDYDFLDSSTLGDEKRLEGYLFPDTYDFYLNIDASSAISKLLGNFEKKMEDNSIYEKVAESDYSLYEILIIASMIQCEAATKDEMPTVASVIYNRLANQLNNDSKLQIDATIQYILPERMENLTGTELEIESLYNTYKYGGLTPTPISNPGINAILAALEPEDTSYLYYALSVDGYHEFFKNYDAHDAFVHSSEFAYYEE